MNALTLTVGTTGDGQIMSTLDAGDRETTLQFSDLDDGSHSYTVVTSDIYGFSASNQLSFTTESESRKLVL